jgi:hypothetical protein
MAKPGIGRPSFTGGIFAVAARAVSALAMGDSAIRLARPAMDVSSFSVG